jgi:hypothetical protein
VSISYPLTPPASPPGFASVDMTGESLTGLAASPFTGQQQVYEWAGQFWHAKCTLPPMTRANAERWISFLLSLRGMAGTFLLGDPLGKTVQGTAGGSPIVNGAGQSGKQLAISGLTGVLKAGDYFHIGSAGENRLLYSQAFDNAVWTYQNCTRPAADTIVAPDGTTTAELLTYTSSGGAGQLWQIVNNLEAGQNYIFSCWLKAPSGTPTLNMSVTDIDTTVLVNAAMTMSGAWQRFSVTFQAKTRNTVFYLYNPSAATNYHAWGAQAEQGSVATGYIATTSTASGPTRQLFKNLTDAGPGTVTLDIFPKLRTPPVNADPLVLANPVGVFRLASNSIPWTADKAKFYGISFEAMEAL